MAQNRFIGVNQDLTQAIFLLMTSTLSKSGVKSGLDASIEPASFAGSFNLRLKAGLFVLPDGMIVQEDADQVFPFEAGLTEKATLIAYRNIDSSGFQSDVVRYDIVPEFVTQLTLDKLSSRVYLPLAWIEKVSSLGTIDDFRIINLGDKNPSLQKSFRAPFVNLLKPNATPNPALQQVQVYNYYSGNQQNDLAFQLSAGTYYLKLDPVQNHVLTNVLVIAQNGKLNFSSFAGQTINQTQLAGTLDFTVADSSTWASQMITYPQTKAINWWLDGDILQLDVLAKDPKTNLVLPPVTLLEIIATWKRVQ